MIDALTFLRTRRSRPAKILTAPYPDRDTLAALINVAARTPDHGKLEPWRFSVLEKPALDRLARLARNMATAADADPDKAAGQFERSGCAVVVIESPKDSAKIPAIEQTYSAGAVCLALLNAGLASGWGANWLSGWASHDRGFVEQGLGLAGFERVAGIIHFGTGPGTMPDRPRPDTAALTTWVDA
ncbi:MAG: nitroreductase family protein [Pseudomonadota bacterium]